MTASHLTPLYQPTFVAKTSSPIRVNIPAVGRPQGYLLAVKLAPFKGLYGRPVMPALTYSGQGGPVRMWESMQHLLQVFPGTCRDADTWDVSLPSADPDDIADAVSVMEMALAQGLATESFSANVHMSAPRSWERLLQRGFTEKQLQHSAADARRQARAWAGHTNVALPARHQGSQHAAGLGIAGMRALSAIVGAPVATPYRRSAEPCPELPSGACESPWTLAGFASLQSGSTLPGLMRIRFPGRTLVDSVARTVRDPRRMPDGQGAEVCPEHGWIWVNGPEWLHQHDGRVARGPWIRLAR